MNATKTVVGDCDRVRDSFAAELTEAVFPVALRYGVGDRWLDLKLDLWHVLGETVRRWARASTRGGSPCEPEAPRSGLLVELADAAYRTTLRHGVRGSGPQAQTALYQAFHSTIGETVSNRGRVSA